MTEIDKKAETIICNKQIKITVWVEKDIKR